jgi:hypothetical protein
LFIAHRQFGLAQELGSLGLNCEPCGVSLAGVPLIRRTEVGFEPRLVGEIDVLAKAAYGHAIDTAALRRGLCVAAQALNERDMGRAMIATLHLKLPELDAIGARRIAAVDAVLAKYSPDQPRDWHGRWTTEGDGSGPTRSLAGGPVGGQLTDTSYQPGEGDNGPPIEPGAHGPEADPEPVPGSQTVPQGWDVVPERTIGGLRYPAVRIPRLPDGRIWPTAEPAEILRILPPDRGTTPAMTIFVPRDTIGPMLIGSDDKEEYAKPPGYDTVRLVGSPQRTVASGGETTHALRSAIEGLRLAATNDFSQVYFNRSFTIVSNRTFQSLIRPDVVAVARPELELGYHFQPSEILSGRQTHDQQQARMPDVPGIREIFSKLLRFAKLHGVKYLGRRPQCS